MDGMVLARLAAGAFLLLAIGVAAMELGRDEEEVRLESTLDSSAQPPLRGELQRCQGLGEAAMRDAACLDVWAQNRRQFLTPDIQSDAEE